MNTATSSDGPYVHDPAFGSPEPWLGRDLFGKIALTQALGFIHGGLEVLSAPEIIAVATASLQNYDETCKALRRWLRYNDPDRQRSHNPMISGTRAPDRLPVPSEGDADRFWANVEIRPEESDECWLWRGGLTKSGYGFFKIKGKTRRAHRLSFLLHWGGDPFPLIVCHRCDNRQCVSPHHLFLGTDADNAADTYQKGRNANGPKNGKYTKPDRTPRGSNSGMSDLTEESVRFIKANFSSSGRWSARTLALKFGVTKGTIHHIMQGRTWRHVVVDKTEIKSTTT